MVKVGFIFPELIFDELRKYSNIKNKARLDIAHFLHDDENGLAYLVDKGFLGYNKDYLKDVAKKRSGWVVATEQKGLMSENEYQSLDEIIWTKWTDVQLVRKNTKYNIKVKLDLKEPLIDQATIKLLKDSLRGKIRLVLHPNPGVINNASLFYRNLPFEPSQGYKTFEEHLKQVASDIKKVIDCIYIAQNINPPPDFPVLFVPEQFKTDKNLHILIAQDKTESYPLWAQRWIKDFEGEIRHEKGVHKDVYIGHNPAMKKSFAVKGVDVNEILNNPKLLEYYKKSKKTPEKALDDEISIMNNLSSSENISKIVYARKGDGMYVIIEEAFEYSLETKLRELEKRGAVLPTEETLKIIIQAVSGLRKLHQKGLYHGDPKPSNLGFMQDGRVVWTDFGLCSLLGADPGKPDQREYVSHVLTRPPELLAGYEHPFENSEVWSVGMILYRMVLGEYPLPIDFKERYDQFLETKDFKEKERIEKELLELLFNKTYIDNRTHIEHIHQKIEESPIHPALAKIIIGCLQISPEKRAYKGKDTFHRLLTDLCFKRELVVFLNYMHTINRTY